MTENKPINTCEFLNICETDCGGTLEYTEICSCYELYKQLARKTQECEELKKQLIQLKQADKKLERIEKLCIKNSNKSSFCNGIENKDMQKLAIRILQIIDKVE